MLSHINNVSCSKNNIHNAESTNSQQVSTIRAYTSKQKSISQLKNSFEFNILFKEGARFNHEYIGIYAMPCHRFKQKLQQHKKYDRLIESEILLGFSINKKVAKATKRHLIKRRIKAIIYMMKSAQIRFTNIVLVFVCRRGILEWDFKALKAHIYHVITKLKVILFKPK